LLTRITRTRAVAQTAQLPFGPAEQTYAEHIHFRDVQMAQATNFLKQEFTYVTGVISNDGVRTVRSLQVTLEFHDPFNQVVLREPELVVDPKAPLTGGQRAPFQITLEHVPAEWNQQYPAIRVTGLVIE
jgi:hypothetical protein